MFESMCGPCRFPEAGCASCPVPAVKRVLRRCDAGLEKVWLKFMSLVVRATLAGYLPAPGWGAQLSQWLSNTYRERYVQFDSPEDGEDDVLLPWKCQVGACDGCSSTPWCCE
jgi:hypothetical protein